MMKAKSELLQEKHIIDQQIKAAKDKFTKVMNGVKKDLKRIEKHENRERIRKMKNIEHISSSMLRRWARAERHGDL
jgi:hypothetical protein